MPTFEQRIDQIIREVIVECSEVTPPLDHREITRHVVEQLSEDMQRVVPSALNRLVAKGVLRDNSDRIEGLPRRYWLAGELAPQQPKARHNQSSRSASGRQALLTIPPANS